MASALGGLPQIVLVPPIVTKIEQIGLRRFPREACGVLLPTPKTATGGPQDQVVELPNRSMGDAEYQLHTSDIRMELEAWSLANPELMNQVAVWHTHPQGGIGPSRGDLRLRLEGVAYLVVALTEEGPVPTWF